MAAASAIPLITLLTDFGTADTFVGSMKGAILGINPEARIVDLTHEVPAHDICSGAYLLQTATRYFPPGTIHVAVVDPGVGSTRRPLLVSTSTQHFLAPDNGLLSYVLAEESDAEIRVLTSQKYFLAALGPTFHGRDLFAPVAAWLAQGEPLDAFGPRINDCVRFEIRRPVMVKGRLVGEVQHIDRFGNLVTNIGYAELRDLTDMDNWLGLQVKVRAATVKGLQRCYADAKPKKLAALVNSDGWLELFCNQTRADKMAKAKLGDRVEIQGPK
ncbi:MAG: SAM-dependent chlorinase/fluorinase [Nitrospirales bacterium]|nr:SAM-dependent chlorinase/fluorinase [Nitrospirales bacterium]